MSQSHRYRLFKSFLYTLFEIERRKSFHHIHVHAHQDEIVEPNPLVQMGESHAPMVFGLFQLAPGAKSPCFDAWSR